MAQFKPDSIMPQDEAKEIFKTSYQLFRKKDHLKALRILDPVLENVTEIENDKLNLLSLMWGIAGDAMASLKSIDQAIVAYRKSIELNENSGCITGYAWIVSKYKIRSELPFAYEIFTNQQAEVKSGPWPWKIFALFVMPRTFGSEFICSIIIRHRLEKMMKGNL